MAFVKLQNRACLTPFDVENAESDYGSDLDDSDQQVLDGVLYLLESAAAKPLVLESIEEDVPLSSPKTAIVPKIVEKNNLLQEDLAWPILPNVIREASIEIEYDEPSRTAFRSKFRDARTTSLIVTDGLTASSCPG